MPSASKEARDVCVNRPKNKIVQNIYTRKRFFPRFNKAIKKLYSTGIVPLVVLLLSIEERNYYVKRRMKDDCFCLFQNGIPGIRLY